MADFVAVEDFSFVPSTACYPACDAGLICVHPSTLRKIPRRTSTRILCDRHLAFPPMDLPPAVRRAAPARPNDPAVLVDVPLVDDV
uniref:Uncharacterized protein n=1 Tax=Panagrolaimus sp. JU765 TaxID=591449 RepID=A0AC34RHN9_9BILA